VPSATSRGAAAASNLGRKGALNNKLLNSGIPEFGIPQLEIRQHRRFVSFVTFDPFVLKNEVNEGNKGKQEVSQEARVPNEISKSTRAGTYS
jgi:hypothetical protein